MLHRIMQADIYAFARNRLLVAAASFDSPTVAHAGHASFRSAGTAPFADDVTIDAADDDEHVLDMSAASASSDAPSSPPPHHDAPAAFYADVASWRAAFTALYKESRALELSLSHVYVSSAAAHVLDPRDVSDINALHTRHAAGRAEERMRLFSEVRALRGSVHGARETVARHAGPSAHAHIHSMGSQIQAFKHSAQRAYASLCDAEAALSADVGAADDSAHVAQPPPPTAAAPPMVPTAPHLQPNVAASTSNRADDPVSAARAAVQACDKDCHRLRTHLSAFSHEDTAVFSACINSAPAAARASAEALSDFICSALPAYDAAHVLAYVTAYLTLHAVTAARKEALNAWRSARDAARAAAASEPPPVPAPAPKPAPSSRIDRDAVRAWREEKLAAEAAEAAAAAAAAEAQRTRESAARRARASSLHAQVRQHARAVVDDASVSVFDDARLDPPSPRALLKRASAGIVSARERAAARETAAREAEEAKKRRFQGEMDSNGCVSMGTRVRYAYVSHDAAAHTRAHDAYVAANVSTPVRGDTAHEAVRPSLRPTARGISYTVGAAGALPSRAVPAWRAQAVARV